MRPAIVVVNDTIIPGAHDPFQGGLTPRESQTRIASYILAVGTPVVGALFAICARKHWWKKLTLWTFPGLCALWFISVAAFATIIFFLPGQATRSTFVLAIIHGMIEISIVSFLLGRTLSQSLIASMLFGLIDFTLAFGLHDIAYVFIVAAIIGGGIDFFIPLLLLYGRRPLLAIGAAGHTVAAVGVFAFIVHSYGITAFSLLSFFALWCYVGFIIAGIRQIETSTELETTNLMQVTVSHKVLACLALVSLVSSTVVTLLLAYVAPRI